MVSVKLLWRHKHYVMQKLKERKKNRKIAKFIISIRNFNTPPSVLDRINRQKITQDIQDIQNIIKPLDLVDIYKTLHLKNMHSLQLYMELSSRYTTIWAIKLVSNIFKRLKYNVFSDHNVIKLEIKNDKNM